MDFNDPFDFAASTQAVSTTRTDGISDPTEEFCFPDPYNILTYMALEVGVTFIFVPDFGFRSDRKGSGHSGMSIELSLDLLV
jgi:hypothetical protein